MGRRRGRKVDGILVLDKPAGMTSNRALQRVRRLLDAAKAGHTGSLDPLATGVLPLCFGEATKFSQHLLDADKVYESTFLLGIETDTGDTQGRVLSRTPADYLDRSAVETVLGRFAGCIEQVPPAYSALKHEGVPLYKLARQGVAVERKPREVQIRELRLTGFRGGEQAEVDIYLHCSKGTYVRSLAADLGAALGCGGCVSRLRRVRAGHFTIEQSLPLAKLESMREDSIEPAAMDSLLLGPDAALGSLPLVSLQAGDGGTIRQGRPVAVDDGPHRGLVRVALDSGEFLGLGEMLGDGRVAPRRLIVATR